MATIRNCCGGCGICLTNYMSSGIVNENLVSTLKASNDHEYRMILQREGKKAIESSLVKPCESANESGCVYCCRCAMLKK